MPLGYMVHESGGAETTLLSTASDRLAFSA
jgi:hypothetical protein